MSTASARYRAWLIAAAVTVGLTAVAGIAQNSREPVDVLLPDASVVFTRPQIVVVSLLVTVQIALIAVLLVQRTRRARVERTLRESEERFRLMVDAAPALVWTAGPDKRGDFFNRPWLEFTGRRLEQELGNGWSEGVHPEDLDRCLQRYTAAFDARERFSLEYRLRRADGVYRWLLDDGVPRFGSDGNFAGYIGSCFDITDRKDSEDALREGRERYAMATAAGAVGVWDWNFETSHVFVDPTLKSILGFEDAAITIPAEEWESRVHPDDLAAVTARVQACIDGSLDEYEVEHRMIHKDGSTRWFLSRGSLLRRPDGTAHRMVGTKVDITERRRAEDAIRENEAVLRESDQEIQHLIGRLIAAQETERARIARDLHDDVSQQLAGLSIALSGLKRRVGASAGGEGLQDAVSALQQRTIGLAESIRHLSHDLHPDVLRQAGLVAALTQHCAEIQRQKTVVLTFSAQGDFETLAPEAALCLYRVAQEALRNVITHAAARHAMVWLRRSGESAELTIMDDGRGFDVVKTRGRRNGLGLISIHERAKLAGGSVSIVTELNKGTQVRARVPVNTTASTDRGDGSGRPVPSL